MVRREENDRTRVGAPDTETTTAHRNLDRVAQGGLSHHADAGPGRQAHLNKASGIGRSAIEASDATLGANGKIREGGTHRTIYATGPTRQTPQPCHMGELPVT